MQNAFFTKKNVLTTTHKNLQFSKKKDLNSNQYLVFIVFLLGKYVTRNKRKHRKLFQEYYPNNCNCEMILMLILL